MNVIISGENQSYSGILVRDKSKNLLNQIAMVLISAVFCVTPAFSQQPMPLQLSPLQQAVPPPPPQPLLGAPIPAPNSVPSAPGAPSDLVRSPLDPMNVDSLPPTLFPQTPVLVDNLTRDKSIYGSVKMTLQYLLMWILVGYCPSLPISFNLPLLIRTAVW